MDIIKETKEVENYIIKCRRDLHKMPEIGFDLPRLQHMYQTS